MEGCCLVDDCCEVEEADCCKESERDVDGKFPLSPEVLGAFLRSTSRTITGWIRVGHLTAYLNTTLRFTHKIG